MTLLRHRATLTCAVLAVLLASGCSGTEESPPTQPSAAAATTDTPAEPAAAEPEPGSDPPAAEATQTPEPDDGRWRTRPNRTWEPPVEGRVGILPFPAGDNVALFHFAEEGEPRRLELVTPTGERLWILDHTDVPELPADLVEHTGTAVVTGQSTTIAFTALPNPVFGSVAEEGAPSGAILLLQVDEDGTVLNKLTPPQDQVVVLTETALVRVDQNRRVLTAYDLNDWETSLGSVDLAPLGTTVNAAALGPRHVQVDYVSGGSVTDTAVVDVAAATMARPTVEAFQYDRTFGVAGDLVLQVDQALLDWCEVSAWRGGQQVWFRNYGAGYDCEIHSGVPYVMQAPDWDSSTNLMALDPATGQEAWAEPYPADFGRLAAINDAPPGLGALVLLPPRGEDRDEAVKTRAAVLDGTTGQFRHFDPDIPENTSLAFLPGGFLDIRELTYHSVEQPGVLWALDDPDLVGVVALLDDVIIAVSNDHPRQFGLVFFTPAG